MITVRISDGLGNQLFQYATARSLAERLGAGLRLDLHQFRDKPPSEDPIARPYRLGAFALKDHVLVDPAESERLEWAWHHRHDPAVAESFRFYVERMAEFDPALFDAPDGSYLRGWFQSERYFLDIAERIRAEFQPSDPDVLPRIDRALASIRRPGRPLVSLHVRRGDYVRHGEEQLLPLAQRRAAMDRFKQADFLVFSDDLAWCRAHLSGEAIAYSPFETAVDDLFAMARCDHHIIANSTFSWWGAWLNPNPERIVVAPRHHRPSWPMMSPDFIPIDWDIV